MCQTIDAMADEALRAADRVAQPREVRLAPYPAPVVRATGIPRSCKIAWSMVPVVFVVLAWLSTRPSWSAVTLSAAGLLFAVVVVFAPFEGVASLVGLRHGGLRPL